MVLQDKAMSSATMLSPAVLPALLERLDNASLLAAGGSCRRMRAASLAPALWTRSRSPPCAAWPALGPRDTFLASLRADRARARGLNDEWCLGRTPTRCLSLHGERLAVVADDGDAVSLYGLAGRRRTHRFEVSDLTWSACIHDDAVAVLGRDRPTGAAGVHAWMACEGELARRVAFLPEDRLDVPSADEDPRGNYSGPWDQTVCWLDRTTVAVSSGWGRLCVWDLNADASALLEALPRGRRRPSWGQARMVRAGPQLVALTAANRAWLCDLRAPSPAVELPTHCRPTALAAAEDGHAVAVGGHAAQGVAVIETFDARAPRADARRLETPPGHLRLAGALCRAGGDAICYVRSGAAHEARCPGLEPLGPGLPLAVDLAPCVDGRAACRPPGTIGHAHTHTSTDTRTNEYRCKRGHLMRDTARRRRHGTARRIAPPPPEG